MVLRRLLLPAALAVFGGCYSPPDAPPRPRTSGHEPTSLVLQAVDAGTGSALADDEMTVRYLVRAPISFEATAVDRVPSVEPYRIEHPVGEDQFVVEVRVEAASYHRMDTVFSVARGTEAGPLTMRMSRRLDRVAADPEPAAAPASPPAPASTGPDRTALDAGNRAFAREQWLAATEAYQRMPEPTNPTDAYARDYLQAKLRQGIAHINRSEYARALEIFEETADMPSAPPDAFLRLAQAQCAVGRTDEGRGTLSQVGRMRNQLTPVEQSRVSALMAYQSGVCSHGEFERAETTRDRVRSGAEATQLLNAFVEGARAMSPVPPDVYNAVQDAERRVLEIRRAMGGRG